MLCRLSLTRKGKTIGVGNEGSRTGKMGTKTTRPVSRLPKQVNLFGYIRFAGIGWTDYLASRCSLPFVKNGRTLGACFDRLASLAVLRCVE